MIQASLCQWTLMTMRESTQPPLTLCSFANGSGQSPIAAKHTNKQTNKQINKHTHTRSPSLPTSEDLPEPPRETREEVQSNEEKLVAQSYSRLAQISLTPFTGGAGGEDRWHDWFKMQREWSENPDSSNQNYFDDGL